MKKLKTVSIIVFLVSVILFVGYTLKEKTSNDPAGPVFEMESDNIAVSVSDGREALLQGVKATDARDGDVTDSVLVESVSPFNEEGKRTVRYVVFDSDGHRFRATFDVRPDGTVRAFDLLGLDRAGITGE